MVLLCTACGSSRKALSDDTSAREQQLLIVTGTIAYDSVNARYDITVSNRQRVPGVLNLADEPLTGSDTQGLNYAQIGKKDRVLSVHRMDNPLIRQMEFHDGEMMGRKTVRVSSSVFNLRVQLDPQATRILIRDGVKTITEIAADTK